MILKLIIGKDGGFLETIHAFSDLEVCETFGVKVIGCEVVLIQNFLWYIAPVDLHVLIYLHCGA